MTAEKPAQPRIQVPESKEAAAPPLELSMDTAKASLDMARDAAEGKTPKKEHIEHLAESLASDLRNNGEQVGKEDVAAITNAMITSFEKSGNEEQMRLPSLGELSKTLDYLHKSYGLDRYKAQLALAGTAFVGLEGLQAVGTYLYNGIANKLTENKDLLRNVLEVASESQTIDKTAQGSTKKFITRALGKTIDIWGPILFRLVAYGIEKPATEQFNKFLKGVGDTVNQRVSDSLLMSEYAFLSDRNPTEIFDIIERGKLATVDLLSTVYGTLIPSSVALLVSGLPNYQLDPKYGSGVFLGYARLPSLFGSSLKHMEQGMRQRSKLIREKERLESRIAGTISNLETAQISGKVDEGSKELAETMNEREALLSGERSEEIKKKGKEKFVDLLFDDLAPYAIAGLDLYKGLKLATYDTNPGQMNFSQISKEWKKYIGSTVRLDPQGASMAAASAYMKLGAYKYAQQDSKYLVNNIVGAYGGNIVQDLADIREMESLLGHWHELDRPDGPKERSRIPTSALPNLDISIRNLHVMNILHDVSFDIKQGEFVSIRAQKGEGKTTLLRAMLGLYKSEQGTVSYGGIPIDGIKKYGPESIHRKFGYAPQNAGFIDTMTLKENLLLWNKDIPEEKLTGTMKDLGLEKLIPRLSETGNHFSGGEKRLLSIVRSLLTNPKILFLDEPTANLDPASIERLVGTLQAIRKNHPETTIISVTHDDDFAKHTDRVINLAELNKKPELQENQVYEAKAKAR